MRLSRRYFLATSAVAATLPQFAFGQAKQSLRAMVGTQRIGPDDLQEAEIWGYEGGVPGPEIRVPQSGRVSREFINDLPQASSVHWHGVRIDNAMDGVVGLTQEAVEPGETFDYDFIVPDAGTYWYHPHNRTWEQMARGLYGPLIIEETNPPTVDRDEVFMIDDWRLTGEGLIDESFGQMMDWSHGGRLGNWGTINGRTPTTHSVQHNERIRLRLINASNSRIFDLSLEGLQGWIVALDGQPLDAPVSANQVILAPAQRADFILDVVSAEGTEGALNMRIGDEDYFLAKFAVAGSARANRMQPPNPLPPNPVPELGDLASARRVNLLMEGGAMGGMRGAKLEGVEKTARELASEGLFWAFNGDAGLPDEPLLVAERGETIRINIINDTSFPHAMHLHGFHFREIGPEGTQGPLRDTILLQRGEVREIAFVADNPGDWLFHCHMLEHSVAGMLTWLKVV